MRIPGTETWTRCTCIRGVLSQHYIKPLLRGADPSPPPPGPAVFPLADTLVLGEYATFRRTAWVSLLQYEPSHLRYEVFEAPRLVRIHFGEDPIKADYDSLRELQEIPLLILIGGVGEFTSEFLGALFTETLKIRRNLGLPTWVYMPTLETLSRYYGAEAVALLGRTPLATPVAHPKVAEFPRTAAPSPEPRAPSTRFDTTRVR